MHRCFGESDQTMRRTYKLEGYDAMGHRRQAKVKAESPRHAKRQAKKLGLDRAVVVGVLHGKKGNQKVSLMA